MEKFIEALKSVGVILSDASIISFREATSELRDRMQLVSGQLRQHLTPVTPDSDDYVYINIEAYYDDHIVIQKDGRYLSYPFTLSADNTVSFNNPVEVTREFAQLTMREANGVFIEALHSEGIAKGTRWRIRAIKAGLSGNNKYYPNAVLREALPLFNGVRVFVKADEEHVKGKGKDFRQLIGKLDNAVFIEGVGKDAGEVQADLHILESAEVHTKLVETHSRGMSDLFGFSIDAKGRAKRKGHQMVATKITKIDSVDLIIEPGAGGELINLIEAQQPTELEAEMSLRTDMIDTIKQNNDGKLPDDLDTSDNGALQVAYREALNGDDKTDPGDKTEPVTNITKSEMEQSIRMVEARSDMRNTILQSKLPEHSKERLRNYFANQASFTNEDVTGMVSDELEYVAKFTEAGKVQGVGELRIEAGETRAEKVNAMLDAFFDKNDRAVTSFIECYRHITGDMNVTGHLRNCDMVTLRESVGEDVLFREALSAGSFSNVLGDSITRRMIADYRQNSRYDVWRDLAEVSRTNDFRTQERTRFGGYGDLPTVPENAAYGALTSPTDEKATYAVDKKGGTETISIEMIKNDDVSAVRRIPMALSRAAKRTLSKFVLDFLATNPTVYDGLALFHASHNNLNTAALSATSLSANRLAMLKQTELDSGDRLGIPAKTLWVPADLEEAGFDLFRRTTNNDEDFVESLQMNVRPVWYWTDVNDWFTTADKDDIPLIEVGFLDGQEEPEIYVQDNPAQGSLFSNDQIKYKIRHIYGGNVLDTRGFQGNLVL